VKSVPTTTGLLISSSVGALAAAASAAVLLVAAPRTDSAVVPGEGPVKHRGALVAARACRWLGYGVAVVAAGLVATALTAWLSPEPRFGHGLIGAVTAIGAAVPLSAGVALISTTVLTSAVRLRIALDAVVLGTSVLYVLWLLRFQSTTLPPIGADALVLGLIVPAVVGASVIGLVLAAVVTRGEFGYGTWLVGSSVIVATLGICGLSVTVHFGPDWAPSVAVVVAAGACAVLAPAGLLAPVTRSRRPGRPRMALGLSLCAVGADCAAAMFEVVHNRALGIGGVILACIIAIALASRQSLFQLDERRYSQRLAESEAHFRTMAHTDSLTGLANRRDLMRALHEEAVGGPPCVLLAIDLDGFKNINDMRGHDLGDAVLVEVGRRLRANLRRGDLAARLGGDEFAVLMWARQDQAYAIAQRVLAAVCAPYDLPQGTVYLTASMGLASGGSAHDVDSLLRNADLALRFAKQRGKDRLERYDAAYDEWLRRRITVEQELRGAARRGELYLAYQPMVSLPERRVIGAEALLRWRHPQLGHIAPGEFILVAEESGLIGELGAWVLHEACRQLSSWLAAGHDLWVSINVSVRELHEPEYGERRSARPGRTGATSGRSPSPTRGTSARRPAPG
jgi:diguanylate cyclase (GGDEF)-like protein